MRSIIVGGGLLCSGFASGCVGDDAPYEPPPREPKGWDGVVNVRELGGDAAGSLAVNGEACASYGLNSGSPVGSFRVRDGGAWIDVTHNCGQLFGDDGTAIIEGGPGSEVSVDWSVNGRVASATVPVPPALTLLEPTGLETVVIGRMAVRWEPAGTGVPVYLTVMTTWCPDDNDSFRTVEIGPDALPELAGDTGSVVVDLRAFDFRPTSECGAELTVTRRREIVVETPERDTLHAHGDVIRQVNFAFR